MPINLTKGQRVDIGLKKLVVALGWSQVDIDVDVCAFLLNSTGQIPAEEFFVFYNNLISKDGAVTHSGDDMSGGLGDLESITVELERLDPRIEQIVIVATIHDANLKGENFGQVRNSYIRIYNTENSEEICKYELDEDYSVETAVEFGRIYKRNGTWRFEAIGNGVSGGLGAFVKKYASAFS
jgi:tellurium resistance protein TerD